MTFAINYLIQCTVRKTGIVSERLWSSRKTAFHCIPIRVFNWNSEWLTTTSWKSNNGWASCYRGRINFAIIWSWRKVNGSFYSPAARTTIMTKSDPTATWKTEIKDKKQSAREFLLVPLDLIIHRHAHAMQNCYTNRSDICWLWRILIGCRGIYSVWVESTRISHGHTSHAIPFRCCWKYAWNYFHLLSNPRWYCSPYSRSKYFRW